MTRVLAVVLLCIAIPALGNDAAWSPPENPDPRAILDEARADRHAGRYAESLAKHVWFHDNALKLDRALAGVRLSFALSDWKQLADRYPPALARMREIRDRDERRVMENKADYNAFHDAVRLNEYLKETDRTVHLFRWLDENDPELAERSFSVARDTLIASGELDLCAKYVGDLESYREELETLLERQEVMRQAVGGASAERTTDRLRNHLAYDLLTDIATLVMIGRLDQARAMVELARAEFGDVDPATIEAAMNGELPDLGEFM
ncbi:MAG: hypothetical protein QNJ00_01125 [Woeseiaceae bacterium]|nr:hypothetical protein [Woeseiaceae bacterium]